MTRISISRVQLQSCIPTRVTFKESQPLSLPMISLTRNFFFFLWLLKQGMITVTLTAWLPTLHPPPCTPEQLAQNQCVKANSTHLGVLILGLCFLTIGSAGIRPCSIPFGVDQFDPRTDEGKKGINSFFNWYYTTFTLVLLVTQIVRGGLYPRFR